MKIMTFNTMSCIDYLEENKTGMKNINFQLMADAIKQCGADIVGLNEIRGRGIREDFQEQCEILAKLSGMEYYYFAQAIDFDGNPYGNALLSKFPIVSAKAIAIPDPETQKYDGYYETRCVLKAEIEGDICVMVTHFGLNPDEQENAIRTVLENLEDEKCVLMGDFNVCPENDILTRIRERMQDTADKFLKPLLSWPADNPGKKLDYIFASRDIEVISADIPEIIASDHRPHIAEIKF